MSQEQTDKSVVTRRLFGYCEQASGDLTKHTCPRRYQRFYFGRVREGRKSVDGIVYLDEYVECTCLCHVPEEERPKSRRRKVPAKKPVKKTTKRKK